MKRIKLGIQAKFILLFAAMTVLLIAGIGYAAYTQNYNQVKNQYQQLAKSSVEMAADLINGDSIPVYLARGADEEYYTSYKRLQDIKINYGLKYLYVFIPDTESRNGVYVFDIFIDGDDPDLVASLGDETGEIDIYDIALDLYLTGESRTTTVVTKSKFGYLASAYTALEDSSGKPVAIVGADIEMNVIISDVMNQTVRILILAIAVIVVFASVALVIVSRQMIRPIKQLSAHMKTYANDKERLSDSVFEAHTGDEIEDMADSFNSMSRDIKLYMENLAEVTADRERIATELNVAKQIQASMLPSIFPPFPDRKEFDLYALMEPAREVGGDFYDFFMIDDRRLAIVIADVSGKGVPAALFMVIAKTLIKNQAGVASSPSEVLYTVNNKLLESNDAGLFVTVFMGILETDTGRFTYSNAGHNPPLISTNGKAFEPLKTDSGFVLAGIEDFPYTTGEITFSPGDRILMFTDGVTEALNPGEELFGDERLIAALNRPDLFNLGVTELVHAVRKEISVFADSAPQADDITILALSFNG